MRLAKRPVSMSKSWDSLMVGSVVSEKNQGADSELQRLPNPRWRAGYKVIRRRITARGDCARYFEEARHCTPG